MKRYQEMLEWVTMNRDLKLNELSYDDADWLIQLAEERTMIFINLIMEGLSMRQKHTGFPPFSSRDRMLQCCLIVRIMINLVRERYDGIPEVYIFDGPSAALVTSRAYLIWQYIHTPNYRQEADYDNR